MREQDLQTPYFVVDEGLLEKNLQLLQQVAQQAGCIGKEEFGGETHVFSPAYKEQDFVELLEYADHFVFNSPMQVKKYAARAKQAGKQVGLRVNPECSTQEGHAIYDPCAVGSRLGTTLQPRSFTRAFTQTCGDTLICAVN